MNRNTLAEKSTKTFICATILMLVLSISSVIVLVPKAYAYVSGPTQSGTVNDWTGFLKAASYGSVCRYDFAYGSVDPYFFPALESH